MATKQTRKCVYCHNKIDVYEPEVMLYNNHYYHLDCFKILKNDIPNADILLKDKQDLWNFLLKLQDAKILDEDYLKGKLNMDLFSLFSAGCTYSGILNTLIYILYIKKKIIDTNRGISVVIYYYDEAKRYCLHQEEYNQKIKDIIIHIEEQTVYVNPDINFEKKLIDISKI